MNRIRCTPYALALIAAVATAGLATAGDGEPERHQRMKLVWNADGSSDRLVIENLDLAPGETRALTTESGKPVSVTRDADGGGYRLDVDGRTLRIGDGEALDLEPGRRVVMKKIELDGEGGRRGFVVSDGEPHVLLLDGEGGEEGFAFRAGPGPHLLGVDHLLARIEQSEKFLALDDTTREIVREVVRDAAPKVKVRRLHGAGDAHDFDVRIERRDDPTEQ